MRIYTQKSDPGAKRAKTEDLKKFHFAFASKNGGYTPGGYKPGITTQLVDFKRNDPEDSGRKHRFETLFSVSSLYIGFAFLIRLTRRMVVHESWITLLEVQIIALFTQCRITARICRNHSMQNYGKNQR